MSFVAPCLAALTRLNLLPFLPWFFQFLNMRLQYGLHTVSKTSTYWNHSFTVGLAGSVTVVMTLHTTNGYHLPQAVVRRFTGNPCLFVMIYLLLSQPMTSFMITHASPRILCLLLSGHIPIINLSSAIIHQSIVIAIHFLLESHSYGIN